MILDTISGNCGEDALPQADRTSLWAKAAAHARADPDMIAVVEESGRTWSRSELVANAEAVVERLVAEGLTGSLRFSITAFKSVETMALALAVSAVGGILCPIPPLTTKQEKDLLFGRLGLAARLELFPDGTLQIDRFPEANNSTDKRDCQLALIGFTSGTTGRPKGVMHHTAALNFVTRWCAENSGLQPGEAILGIMPFDSAAGYAFTVHFALSYGSPLVLIGRWDPVAAMQACLGYDCRWTTGVPTHLLGLIATARSQEWRGVRLPLRAFAVGGASIDPQLVANARQVLGIEVLRQYGLSEVLAPCSTRLDDPEWRRETLDGIANPGCHVAAFDEAGHRLAAGTRGEGGLRAPSQCVGYAEGLGQGEERITADGYFLTGDEVVVDADGYVKVVGRIKGQIIRGGYNIDPSEVEAAISIHPQIAEIAVIGVPHDVLGEQSCAVCRWEDDAAGLTLEQLQEHLKAVGLSKRKWPEVLHVLDKLPLLPSGKIDKMRLMQDLI